MDAPTFAGNGRGREGKVASIGTTAHTAGSMHKDIVASLKSLMIEHSLPLWSGEGWDPGAGGFVERLDIEGRADRAEPRRVRVQARQIYSFAKVAQIGWYPEGREIAIRGLDYLLAKAKSPDGRQALFTCWVRMVPQSTRCAIPMTTPSCCSRCRRYIS